MFLDFIIINETASEKTHTTTQESSNIQKTSEIYCTYMIIWFYVYLYMYYILHLCANEQGPKPLFFAANRGLYYSSTQGLPMAIIWIPINQPVE